MTPATRVVLATLADVYEDWPGKRFDGLGPYGVTSVRTGVPAYRVAEIEKREGLSHWIGDYRAQAARIRERLAGK